MGSLAAAAAPPTPSPISPNLGPRSSSAAATPSGHASPQSSRCCPPFRTPPLSALPLPPSLLYLLLLFLSPTLPLPPLRAVLIPCSITQLISSPWTPLQTSPLTTSSMRAHSAPAVMGTPVPHGLCLSCLPGMPWGLSPVK